MRISQVSPQQWRRLEEYAEAAIHITRAGVRPGLEFLESHGKSMGHTLDLTETLSGTDRGFAAGLGLANLVLGAAELSQSYQALCAGDRVRGYLNAAGGTSSLVGGTALVYAAWTGSAALGPLGLTNLGAASTGIAAAADGLEDVVLACRGDHGKLAIGLGGLKVASGGVLLAGAMTAHPTMQAAGSLLYLVAAGGQHLRTHLA